VRVTFQTTRWSLILRARQRDAEGVHALDELLGCYWQPVYGFYRRLGADRDAAADLTQGLFADLLSRGDLATAAPEAGRFRGFLRSCARHWWANERQRAAAQKRGGGRQPVQIDADDMEAWLDSLPVDDLDAEAVYERRWAQTVIDRALARLEREERAADRHASFQHLRTVLDGGPPPVPWAVLAGHLQTTEGALKVAAHRLKLRFRDCLTAEVRETLPDGCDPGDELRELLVALQARARRGIPGDSR
jgi:RNA polymerase sigma-70 factor (ECF subfamily)